MIKNDHKSELTLCKVYELTIYGAGASKYFILHGSQEHSAASTVWTVRCVHRVDCLLRRDLIYFNEHIPTCE